MYTATSIPFSPANDLARGDANLRPPTGAAGVAETMVGEGVGADTVGGATAAAFAGAGVLRGGGAAPSVSLKSLNAAISASFGTMIQTS